MMTWSHLCHMVLYLGSHNECWRICPDGGHTWPRPLGSVIATVSYLNIRRNKVKSQQKFPSSSSSCLFVLLSRNIECRGKCRLIYLNVWVDGFCLTDIWHEICSMRPINVPAMNISDWIKILLSRIPSGKERTKSNVNGIRLILRT